MSNSEIEFKQIRNTIIRGLVSSYLPIIIWDKNESFFESLPVNFQLLANLIKLILILYGYIICWKAAYKYAKYKGYSGYIGIVAGMLNIQGLSFLFLLKNRNYRPADSSKNNALENLSISSIFISYAVITLFFFSLITYFVAYIQNMGIEEAYNYSENKDFLVISYIPISICVVWYFFKKIKPAQLNLRLMIGSFNKINLKLPLGLAIAEFFFAWGFNNLTLYGLSFIVPNYVEEQINYEYSETNIGFIAFVIAAIIFAPILEEMLFRGIILQKISLKKDIKSGILTSAFLFTIVHFRYDIFSLFTMGIILAILYLKTKQLIIPIAFHFFYNFIVTIWLFYHKFLSNYDHSVLIKIAEYQQDFIDHLGSRVLFIALSAPYLIYFIYKNFPRNYDINKLPYFANQKDYIN